MSNSPPDLTDAARARGAVYILETLVVELIERLSPNDQAAVIVRLRAILEHADEHSLHAPEAMREDVARETREIAEDLLKRIGAP